MSKAFSAPKNIKTVFLFFILYIFFGIYYNKLKVDGKEFKLKSYADDVLSNPPKKQFNVIEHVEKFGSFWGFKINKGKIN